MKEFDRIPVSKVHRASKFITTGARIGTNYLKHYSKKLVNGDTGRDQLHQDNARDIYNSLSELKGSALKVAQMLSMDKTLLPTAYQQKFTMAQYSAPPLSYPLVAKIFRQQFGKSPDHLFDSFTRNAVNAASMGQVHQAVLNGRKLAIKIQYPGVGDSIKSDLAMVKPIALTMFKLNPADYDEFMREVEDRMLEEADYRLELQRSIELSGKTSHLKDLIFPGYYPEYSGEKVLTMDWLEGDLLGEVLRKPVSGEIRNKLGQAMWDFYNFQMHALRSVHADPHPGNFIVTPDHKLGIIDFGCVKNIPDDFYGEYFKLLDRNFYDNPEELDKVFHKLRFLYDTDTPEEKQFFRGIFVKLLELLSRPFRTEVFDFSDKRYFESLYKFGEELASNKALRESKKTRGVRDAIYINRTYFGLYSILHDLKATVRTGQFELA